MKQLALLVLLVTAFVFDSTAQQQQNQIKIMAEHMAKATLSGDYKTLAKYTHPKIVKMMGGQDNMIATLSDTFKKMHSQGYMFENATVGTPGKVVTVGKELYAVVPQRIQMKANGMSISTTTSLLANSADNGKHWYFTDAGSMTDEQVKKLFPGLSGKLVIPKRTMPVLPQ